MGMGPARRLIAQALAGGLRRAASWLPGLALVVAGTGLSTMLFVGPEAGARTADFSVAVTGDEAMGKDLKELVKTSEKEQPSSGEAIAILQMAQARKAQVAAALRSRGFYDASIVATIAGQPVDDPAAFDAIEAQPESQPVHVNFTVETGPVYKIATLDIEPAVPGASLPAIDRTKLNLAPGQAADSAAILAAQAAVLEQMRAQSYALAALNKREVVVDHATHEVHVAYFFDAGPPAKMGAVSFAGSEHINSPFLQRRVPFAEGEPYNPAKVQDLRDSLTGLGVFSAVRVKPATQLNDRGELPIDVELIDRAPRTIGFGAAYETRLGGAVNAFWLHRNLFGQAESLRLSGEVDHIGQGSLADLGFNLTAAFRKPDWWLRGQDLTAQASALSEILPAYNRKAVLFGTGLERAFSPQLRGRAGLSLEFSTIQREGVTQSYRLLGVPLGVTFDRTNNPLDPSRGYRLAFNLTPYLGVGNLSDQFAVIRATGSSYFDFSDTGRSVLAARASFGMIPNVQFNDIPADKLFYAGGGGSVRGFAYQSAGPRDAFLNPLGGASVVEGSLEFRQRIGKSWGAVAFLDAGSAYTPVFPDFYAMAPRIGTGVGARYYTDFGPIRVDVGVPLNPRAGDAPFGLYVSLGQSF
jgi:translocation and assembly module TamA